MFGVPLPAGMNTLFSLGCSLDRPDKTCELQFDELWEAMDVVARYAKAEECRVYRRGEDLRWATCARRLISSTRQEVEQAVVSSGPAQAGTGGCLAEEGGLTTLVTMRSRHRYIS